MDIVESADPPLRWLCSAARRSATSTTRAPDSLRQVQEELAAQGITLVLCGCRPQSVANCSTPTGSTEKIGAANYLRSTATWSRRTARFRARRAAPGRRRCRRRPRHSHAGHRATHDGTRSGGPARRPRDACRSPPRPRWRTGTGPAGPGRAARGAGDDPLPELVPVRYGRMAASPFTFYRGAALPMAADLAADAASSGITGPAVRRRPPRRTSACSRRPSANLLFDVNDFDETLPGPFEWDLKRLAASIVVAGRVARLRRARRPRTPSTRPSARTASGWPSTPRCARSTSTTPDVRRRGDHRLRRQARAAVLQSTVKSAAHHDALHELPKLTAVARTAGAGSSTARRSSSTVRT